MSSLGRFFFRGPSKPRASVFLLSILIVLVAAFSVMAWVSFVTESQRQAARDQARLHAFMAAEAGIEQVVDWFNHPGYLDYEPFGNYPGKIPDEYVNSTRKTYNYGTHPPCAETNGYNFVGYETKMFEPYVITVSKSSYWEATEAQGSNTQEKPVWVEVVDTYGENGPPIPTRQSWFDKAGVSKIPSCELEPQEGDPPFVLLKDDAGDTIAYTTSLMLVNPVDFATLGETVPSFSDRVICKIVSTATSPRLNGATVTVEALLRENPLFKITSPGAIVSGTDSAYNGQFNVHWGEVWARENIPIAQTFYNKINATYDDPWLNVRTEKYIIRENASPTEYARGDGTTNGFSTTPVADPAPGTPVEDAPTNYYMPYDVVTDPSQDHLIAYTNLQQHQELPFPTYDYDDVKDTFLSAGLPYYYTGPDGYVYGIDPDTGTLKKDTFENWFGTTPADDDVYWNVDEMLVFIDSVPVTDEGVTKTDPVTGYPVIDDECYPRGPDDPNVNHGKITVSGNGVHTRGAMFVNTNLDFGGEGNPSSASNIKKDGDFYVRDPDPTNDSSVKPDVTGGTKIGHNGLLFNWGTLSQTGNRTIYGSIYTVGGFDTGGGPEVYYNYRMKDGSWLPVFQSAVLRSGWAVRQSDLPDLDLLSSGGS